MQKLPNKYRTSLLAQYNKKMGKKKKQFIELTKSLWIHINPYNCITLWYNGKKVYDETVTLFIEQNNRDWISYLKEMYK